MLGVILAYFAGLLTLINPCVLPLLPLIAAGAVSRHRLGPLAMALGMAVSFTIAGIAGYSATRALGLVPDDIQTGAGWLMLILGVILLVPQAQAGFSRLAGAAAGGGTRLVAAVETRGLFGEAAAGALLGLAWSPCIGPTLGGAIALASQGEDLAVATATMASFAAGSATVLLALSYGARSLILRRKALLNRLMPYSKVVLAAGMILLGLFLLLHLDRVVEAWLLDVLPSWLIDASVSL